MRTFLNESSLRLSSRVTPFSHHFLFFSIFFPLCFCLLFLLFFPSFFFDTTRQPYTGLLIRQRPSDPATDRRRNLSRYYYFFFFFEVTFAASFFFFFLLLITCNMRNRILFVKDIPYTTRLR